MIAGILSLRKIRNEAFRQIVYEWEDEIATLLDIPIINVEDRVLFYKKDKSIIDKVVGRIQYIKKLKKLDIKDDIYISICTLAGDCLHIQKYNCIPIFLDLWNYNIDFLIHKTRNRTPFFVTTLDMYKKINQIKGVSVRYMPLAMSSKWEKKPYSNKRPIDIFQFGRKNSFLHESALKYAKTHRNINYIYSDKNGTQGELMYYSTKYKNQMFRLGSRESYVSMLNNTRVCLVSSPGVDGEKIDSEDIDFPTPRFYEAAYFNCIMLGRYSNHDEFFIQHVDKICPNIINYEQFEELLDSCLSDSFVFPESEYMCYNEMHSIAKWTDMLKANIKLLIGDNCEV